MTIQAVINSIASKFDSEWDSNTYSIEWPNVPMKHTTVPYVRFSIVFFPSENAVVGGSVQKHRGLITISIFSAINVGYGIVYSIATSIINILQNKQFDSVFTYAASVIDVGKDPEDSGLYMINVTIPFEAVL